VPVSVLVWSLAPLVYTAIMAQPSSPVVMVSVGVVPVPVALTDVSNELVPPANEANTAGNASP
jgi:hypothetical protein